MIKIKKFITFLISAFAILLLTSCINDSASGANYVADVPSTYEQPGEKDLTDEYPDALISEGVCLENIPNYFNNTRTAIINTATASPRDQIVHVGETIVSRTGIVFTLENLTELEFFYGDPWDLAFYADDRWMPVMYVAEIIDWNAIGNLLPGGSIKRYRIEWDRLFGELPPGRYMFIRDGWLGERHQEIRDRNRVYALVEFIINEDCPIYLPPAPSEGWQDNIHFVKYKDVTPNGMNIVIANASDYDIEFHADIVFIVPQIYAVSDCWWDWWHHFIPRLPMEYHRVSEEGILISGGQLEFFLDWLVEFGKLPPGDYVLLLRLSGWLVHPPYPFLGTSSVDLKVAFSIDD